jgi:hypothetical protein
MREGHTSSDQEAVWSKYGDDVMRKHLPWPTIQKFWDQAGFTRPRRNAAFRGQRKICS